MKRSLRPRNVRPRYASTRESDDDDANEHEEDENNRSRRSLEEDENSGSDFRPDTRPGQQPGIGTSHDLADTSRLEQNLVQPKTPTAAESSSTTTNVHVKQSAKAKGKRKAVLDAPTKLSAVQLPPGLTRPRQMYALPTPSLHHRHRAIPLFICPGQVERLESPPAVFEPARTVLTNSFTHNPRVTDRISKAYGYNVGSGPLWELAEDRGWYKEALPDENGVGREASRRPRVYAGLRVADGWALLNINEALPYLPSCTATLDEPRRLSPTVTCSFGPFGRQTRHELSMFDSHTMSEFVPESKAHIFYAGAPVWGLDWCPIHIDDRPHRFFKQYLAVAPFPSHTFSPGIGCKVPRPSKACIQIWSLGPSQLQVIGQDGSTGPEDEAIQAHDNGMIRCEIVLCVDAGPAHDVRWCPLPSHDAITEIDDVTRPRRLGLAGTFQDGSMSIYAVPEPYDLLSAQHDSSQPVYVHLPLPLIRAELEETACWCLDWANSEVIAVGTTNGAIAVYHVGDVLKSMENSYQHNTVNILPTHYISIHQSAIRTIAWIRTPPTESSGAFRVDDDPTVIATGGYDGLQCLTDIREGTGCIMNRTRDIIYTMTFSPFVGGPVTIDHENIVKQYSASPGMLGRGHVLFEPDGPVWSVHASDYHPQIALGCSDGTCSTTNTLRSTRRGGSVPFFVHKIYQMDYNRNSDELRMLERFLPVVQTQDKPTGAAAKGQGKGSTSEVEKTSSGAWPQQVGIHRVTWNSANGLGAAGMLASATASGICRVDWLQGRWMKGRVPYGSVSKIRGELDMGEMEVDNSLSEE